jgi:hypothetical protein
MMPEEKESYGSLPSAQSQKEHQLRLAEETKCPEHTLQLSRLLQGHRGTDTLDVNQLSGANPDAITLPRVQVEQIHTIPEDEQKVRGSLSQNISHDQVIDERSEEDFAKDFEERYMGRSVKQSKEQSEGRSTGPLAVSSEEQSTGYWGKQPDERSRRRGRKSTLVWSFSPSNSSAQSDYMYEKLPKEEAEAQKWWHSTYNG